MSSSNFKNHRKEAKTEEDEYQKIFAKQLAQCLQNVAIAANNLVEVIDNPYISSNSHSYSPQKRPSTPNNIISRKVIDVIEHESQLETKRFIETKEVNKELTISDNNRQFIPQSFRSPPNADFIFLEQLNAYEKTKKLVHNLVNDRFDGLMNRFDERSKQRKVRRTIRYMNFRDKIEGESLSSFMKRFDGLQEEDKSSKDAMEEGKDIKEEKSRTTRTKSCRLSCSENIENSTNMDGPGEGNYSKSSSKSTNSFDSTSEIQNNNERNIQNQDLQTSKQVKHTKKLHGLLRRISFLSRTLKVLKN